MKEPFKKIVRSSLLLLLAVGIVTATTMVTQQKTNQLSASVLDTYTPADVTRIDFVSPKGTAYPINNVVTINSVFVDMGGLLPDGNVSGSDLENSFITFGAGVPACPAGTVYNNNKIVLPSTYSGSCNIRAYAGGALKSTTDLTIQTVSCSALQTSILRGQGAGFENILSTDLGAFAISSTSAFNFGNILNPVDSIDLNYPVTAVSGAKTFQIHFAFVPDVSVDPINGIDARAKIIANSGDGVYEIKVRDEGTGKQVDTALNFAYVFNDLLGTDSPFVAFPYNADPKVIRLQSTEMGAHPNTGYVCMVDGAQVLPCFAGGLDGTGEGAGVLTTPLKLDNEVVQGESATVFASQSAGEVQWISSHPSILEVKSFSEAAQQDQSTVDFVDKAMPVAGVYTLTDGAYTVGKCNQKFDTATPSPNFLSETCDTSVKIPVKYNITGQNFTVNVSIKDEVVPVIVQGTELNGFLEGTSTYATVTGAGYNLTGKVTGVVTGSVSGAYSGTVTGQIQATVQNSATLTGLPMNSQLTVGAFSGAGFSATAVTAGTLTDVSGTFTSTVKKQQDDVSHIAILYAKRPGISILSAMDKQGCIASFEVNVIKKQVILQMVGRDPGDVLDVSDSVQINAFAGGANHEINEYENITAASGIEWFSSNEDVASVDKTGLLTALKPGVTNITARYDTGDAEIGTIESIPLQVTVNKISGLRVTFDKGTENKLPAQIVKDAHKSVIIAIHNPTAAGQTFMIEGHSVNINLPTGTYTNDISKVEAITTQLKAVIGLLVNSIAQPVVKVTSVDGYPGMLILQPLNQTVGIDSNGDGIENIDENGIIDISTTALQTDVAILPTYSNAIPLPASDTYGLQVIAQYDNGATKLLPPTLFKWVNSPTNYLEQASLDSGLIRLGANSGTSTVVAQYENADASVVHSNYLTITVDSGPVIEFVRRIGSGSVTKGSRMTLQAKVTDMNTIANITDISTSLVFSNFNTYQQINEDSSAIWFAATPFMSEVTVVDQTPAVTTPADTTGTGTGTGTPTPAPAATPAPVSPKFKTYNIPIEIPVDANLFDGIYKLILTITDAENHTLNYVYPVRIGDIGKGDVNGDGATNMIDVILAFQIASGLNKSPTPSELQAANVDGVGGVNLIDVILLFNKVTNQ